MTCLIINRPSDSARTLARALGIKRVRPERFSRLRHRFGINWGCSNEIGFRSNQIVANLNSSNTSKLRAFQMMEGKVNIPDFSRDINDLDASKIILARTMLNSHSGNGIVVVRPGEEAPPAPLYTQYIPKRREYRVHVFNGRVIFVQQKRKRNETEQTPDERLIRNHANGWVFAENSVEFESNTEKALVESQSIKAVQALCLNFGAVDIIVSNDDGHPCVIEVNTAPGLKSTKLLEAYVSSIRSTYL